MDPRPVARRRGVVVASFLTLVSLPLLVPRSDTAPEATVEVSAAPASAQVTRRHPEVVAASLSRPSRIRATTTTAPPETTSTTSEPSSTTTAELTTTTEAPATTTTAAPTTTTTAAPTTTTTAAPSNDDEGKASWYEYRDNTCAHRTLELGTIVRVTNLDNGRSTTCEVADRGPYVEGWIIDLDKRVFAEIADTDEGVIDVRIAW